MFPLYNLLTFELMLGQPVAAQRLEISCQEGSFVVLSLEPSYQYSMEVSSGSGNCIDEDDQWTMYTKCNNW